MAYPPQAVVNIMPAPGISGEFCSENPRASLLAGVGALVAGPAGVTAGQFAWASEQGVVTNAYAGPQSRLGFVSIYQPIVNPAFLQVSGLLVQAGQEMTLHDTGDFWCAFAAGAVTGQKVYVNLTTGAATAAAMGSPTQAASVTAAIAANATNTFTGVIAAPVFPDTGLFVLTASSVTGTIVAGATLSGTGVPTGQTIIAQLTGTAGGAGTYTVSIPQTTASTTITGAYGVMTVSAVGSGALALGQPLTGSGVTAGTYITQLGTGTGGTGTYYVNNNTVVSSTTITANANLETKWYVNSSGAPGEVCMIGKSWGI